MDRCSACGATLTAGAAWCGQCFAAVGAPPAAGVNQFGIGTTSPPPGVAFRAGPAQQPLPAPVRTTRWGKTPTTFGPLGRTVATVGLLIPLALTIVGGLVDPFIWGGAAVWGIVMRWALRDIWKAGRVQVG